MRPRSRQPRPSTAHLLATLLAATAATACLQPQGSADPVRFPSPFQIIAHRGASAYAPENTLAAFRRARELGAVEVELDVQLTADDRVILFHDKTLDEKTGHSGRVRDHTAAELEAVDIGTWFDAAHPDVPERFAGTGLDLLEDLFEAMGRAFVYHVELKDGEPGLPAATLADIDRFSLRDRVVVTSFRLDQLERMQALAPELPICLLIDPVDRRDETIEAWIDRAAAMGFHEVGVASRELTRAHVERAHDLGLWIRAWRIKGPDDMQHAIDVGSNGMTIDWPERLVQRLLEHAGSAQHLAR